MTLAYTFLQLAYLWNDIFLGLGSVTQKHISYFGQLSYQLIRVGPFSGSIYFVLQQVLSRWHLVSANIMQNMLLFFAKGGVPFSNMSLSVIHHFVITLVFKLKPVSLLPNMKLEIHHCQTDNVNKILSNTVSNSYIYLDDVTEKVWIFP